MCPSATVYHSLTCQTKVGQSRTRAELFPKALTSLDRSCKCTFFFFLQPQLLSLKLKVYIKTTAVSLFRTVCQKCFPYKAQKERLESGLGFCTVDADGKAAANERPYLSYFS